MDHPFRHGDKAAVDSPPTEAMEVGKEGNPELDLTIVDIMADKSPGG